MNPVINRLKKSGLDFTLFTAQDVLDHQFSCKIKSLSLDEYRKIVAQHQVLQLEYSVLSNQLVNHLTPHDHYPMDRIREKLIAALMFAELLEHLHLYYLDVPREVEPLRRQQKVYRELLTYLALHPSSESLPDIQTVAVGLSLSQHVRAATLETNWYRLLFIRCKRVLDVIEAFEACTPGYREFVMQMDKYANPIIAYLGWCFYLPRLFTNLILLLKHTIPWSSMSEEEKSLGWLTRLSAQIQRRWFELGNDVVWVTVGLINCFLLVGALSPFGTYLTITFYAFDVLMAAMRAAIELTRLSDLQHDYQSMLEQEQDEENKREIEEYMGCLKHRMHFEMVRLGMNIASTTAIFLAMCFAIPAFAINPIIPLIGAVWLVAICVVGFSFTRILEYYRPSDNVEKASGIHSFGLFAKRTMNKNLIPTEPQLDMTCDNLLVIK